MTDRAAQHVATLIEGRTPGEAAPRWLSVGGVGVYVADGWAAAVFAKRHRKELVPVPGGGWLAKDRQ